MRLACVAEKEWGAFAKAAATLDRGADDSTEPSWLPGTWHKGYKGMGGFSVAE